MSFRPLLLAAIGTAVAGSGLPYLLVRAGHFDAGVVVGIVVALLWFSLLLMGIRRYGNRGFWILTAAPGALFVPAVLAFWLFKCAQGGDPNWTCP